MHGLEGCTAIVAGTQAEEIPLLTGFQSPKGLYAGHLWEGSSYVGGASAFRRTDPDKTAGKVVKTDRPLPEFQAVAVDIFGQVTPETERNNREHWRSLADLKQYLGDPFGDGSDVEIFIMTKDTT